MGIKLENIYIEENDYTKLIINSPMYGKFEFLLDNEDVQRVKLYHWCIFHATNKNKETSISTHFYYASTNNKSLPSTNRLLHRFIMNAEKGYVVDHIYGNTLDMRKENMRQCTIQENTINMGKINRNTSGYKGVVWNDRELKWMAYICKDYHQHTLGYFNNIEDAAECRRKSEEQYFGEFNRPIDFQ